VVALLTTAAVAASTDPFQPLIPAKQVAIVAQARTDRLNGDAKAAIAKLLPVIKENPNYYSANYGLALAYERLGHKREAIKYLSAAKAIRDSEKIDDVSIFNTLGWLYLTNGEYKLAQENLEEAASYEEKNSRETNSRVFDNLGLLYLTTGDYIKSQKAFETAMQFGSNTAAANLNILHAVEKAKVPVSTTVSLAMNRPSPQSPTARPMPTPKANPTASASPVPADLSVTPSAISFGQVRVGKKKTKVLRLSNASPAGGSIVTVQGVAVSGSDGFSAVTTCSKVRPKKTCLILVSFSPSGPGAANGILLVNYDAGNGPHRVRIAGTGVSPSIWKKIFGG
jgi:Tfp pilus assembly protein PilF